MNEWIGDLKSPILLTVFYMITADSVKGYIEEELRRNDLFLIDLTVGSANRIRVVVDSLEGITVDECARLSRIIENKLDRNEEDFDLEVSSPGLNKPLVMPFQYLKNIGRQIEVLTLSDQKIKGTLIYADEKKIEMETETRMKIKGKKKKETIVKRFPVNLNEIRSAKVVITF
jgi:ribosome maturation factor RimP